MTLREKLLAGMVNPAHPLALNAARQLDPGTYANSGAGGITLAVHTTQFFANRSNKEPHFTGQEAATALLNDSTKCRTIFGEPQVSWQQTLDWTAHRIETGGRSLGKPTHIEARDGKF